MTVLFYGVDGVTILEPCDKNILAKLDGNCNIYNKLVLFLKLEIQTYYNLRMVLGLESTVIEHHS
jgi:hypothetical protein